MSAAKELGGAGLRGQSAETPLCVLWEKREPG